MWERRSSMIEMEDKDPLARLYQIKDVDSSALEEEALVLVARLLDNIEEFCELRVQIMDVMAVDEQMENSIADLLKTLIDGLKVEQSFLNVELTI